MEYLEMHEHLFEFLFVVYSPFQKKKKTNVCVCKVLGVCVILRCVDLLDTCLFMRLYTKIENKNKSHSKRYSKYKL